MNRVGHHVFIVVISRQMPENPFGHTAFVPATQPPMHVLPVARAGRQITSGDACAITIQHSFCKQAIIRGRAADMTFTTWEKILYPFSLVVTQAIPSHFHLFPLQQQEENITDQTGVQAS
ncbi:hypothetical protein [Acetobacter musti]|uniref:hypothetical protein n=1 Tax=Acetobacter musti TaxID=864732 RepID=UPI00156BC315|nr:hypothetical protein [Acetobacter musti]